MSRRDRLNDAPPHNFVGQLAMTPLADRSVGVGRLLTRHGDDLAHLLRRELRRGTRSRGIGQPLGHADFLQRHIPKLEPTLPPETRRLVIQSEPPRDLRIVLPIASRQDDPCPRDQLLASSMGAYQPFQICSLGLAQHNLRGAQRHSRS